MSISVLILALNEENILRSCLESVNWSDDIVVLDSGSTDRTVEIAKSYGARVLYRPFDNEREQRTFSIREIKFKYPWVYNPEGRIPAEDGIFDTVWSSEVIEHIFDVPRFLSEVNRVLKPGGLLVLTTPYHGKIKNILISMIKFDKHFNPEGEHIRFFDKTGLERCLKKAGFQPISWSGIGRVPGLYRTWFIVAQKSCKR